MGEQFEERLYGGFGGHFRYIATNPAGERKLVFGITPGKFETPQGQLDVWVPVRGLAKVASRTEDEIRSVLVKHPVLAMHVRNCWIRLTSVQQAEALVAELRALATHPAGPSA